MDKDLVAKAAVLAPDTVLRTLAAASRGAELQARPVVRLRLSSGHIEEGRLLGVGVDRTDEIVVLGSPPHRYELPHEAVYLRMRDVVSAGVIEAERFRDVLSGGALPAARTAPRTDSAEQSSDRSQHDPSQGGRMGLAERRAAEQFRTEQFPDWQRKINEAASFEVPVEVAWSELAVDDYATSYGEFFPKVYFDPLVRALAGITIDDMGKEALKDGLTKIVIKNSGNYASETGFSFTDGVLTLDHRSDTNIDYGDERTQWLQKLMESNL